MPGHAGASAARAQQMMTGAGLAAAATGVGTTQTCPTTLKTLQMMMTTWSAAARGGEAVEGNRIGSTATSMVRIADALRKYNILI